jgi:serine protease Do
MPMNKALPPALLCAMILIFIRELVHIPSILPAAGGSNPRVSGSQDIPQTELAQIDFRHVINSAKDKVFPAVVFIKSISENHEGGRKVTQEATGSGVLISPDGQVLTNWHVVHQAVEVRCLLFDGRHFEAKVLGTDKDTDLALLQLQLQDHAPPLPYAELGDSAALKEGDFVMAMGAPWGLSRSVSLGIISCTTRYLPEAGEYSLWLQTDAAISPGNSGGPLVDTAGTVVGLNTRGMIVGGDLGFAIPAATISQVIPELREHGAVNWSWTGLDLQPINDFNRNMYFGGTEGVIISDVELDSPASAASLVARDRILSINGEAVRALTDEGLPAIRRTLGLLEKDVPAKVVILRGDTELTLELTPRGKGEVEGEEHDFPRWDFTAKAINQFANPDLHFHRKQGVFVYGVEYPGNAADAGLQSQDILLKVGDQEVTTLEELKDLHTTALDGLPAKRRLVITVLRNGMMRQIVLDFSRDYSKR